MALCRLGAGVRAAGAVVFAAATSRFSIWRRHYTLRIRVGVRVVPFGVSSLESFRLWSAGGFFVETVVDEGRDLVEIECRDHHRHHDLGGGQASNSAARRTLEVVLATALDLRVDRLDGVAGVLVERLPFPRAVIEALKVSLSFFEVEGGTVLLADVIEYVSRVGLSVHSLVYRSREFELIS